MRIAPYPPRPGGIESRFQRQGNSFRICADSVGPQGEGEARAGAPSPCGRGLGEGFIEPDRDCPLCPRLVAYRAANRAANPAWHNAPVAGFGPRDARLLIVGLAPGLRGANRTGRPFTGDFAGVLLYATLLAAGLAEGTYGADPADGLVLRACRIVNAVRCAPPANLPLPAETRACNRFLAAEIAAMPQLRAMLALGGVAHGAVLRACGLPLAATPFRHGAVHPLPRGLLLADSYHVSRLNTNTGRLTAAMFEAVVTEILQRLKLF